eukprot:TRINITY_DN50501_c0_g4_i2.p1 TRINITY_DN50501_c0_g4~~TRINITY_DN50501_c0_g4_i2.p1  ORF type:complete len:355 (-),score=-8.10 TRINITY_DN50501_c0_g4_i2:219-1244(-)
MDANKGGSDHSKRHAWRKSQSHVESTTTTATNCSSGQGSVGGIRSAPHAVLSPPSSKASERSPHSLQSHSVTAIISPRLPPRPPLRPSPLSISSPLSTSTSLPALSSRMRQGDNRRASRGIVARQPRPSPLQPAVVLAADAAAAVSAPAEIEPADDIEQDTGHWLGAEAGASSMTSGPQEVTAPRPYFPRARSDNVHVTARSNAMAAALRAAAQQMPRAATEPAGSAGVNQGAPVGVLGAAAGGIPVGSGWQGQDEMELTITRGAAHVGYREGSEARDDDDTSVYRCSSPSLTASDPALSSKSSASATSSRSSSPWLASTATRLAPLAGGGGTEAELEIGR